MIQVSRVRFIQAASLLAFAVVFSAGVLVMPNRASAMSDHYFDNASTDCDLYNDNASAKDCNNAGQFVRLITGQSTNVAKTLNQLRVYYHLPSTRQPDGTWVLNKAAFPGNLRLVITHANFCPAVGEIPDPGAGLAADNLGNGYYASHALASGSAVTNYYILNPNTDSADDSVKGTYGKTAAHCKPDKELVLQARDFTWARGVDSFTATQGTFYVDFVSEHINQKAGELDGILNSFSLNANGTGVFKIANVGSGTTRTTYAATVRIQDPKQTPSDNTHNRSIRVPFGSDCTVKNKNTPTNVSFYDVDYSAAQGIIRGALARQLPNSDRWEWWVSPDDDVTLNNPGPIKGSWNSAPTTGAPLNPPPSAYQTLKSVNGRDQYWGFTSDPGAKYVMFLTHVNPVLVQQYSAPYDGIYFVNPCDQGVTPSVDVQDSLTAGGVGTIRPELHGNGTLTGHITDYTLTYWYSDTGNDSGTHFGQTPVPHAAGPWEVPAGATSVPPLATFDVSPLAAGHKYLCAHIEAEDTTNNTNVNDGNTDCGLFGEALQPYLSVYGGDTVAGKTAQYDSSGGESCYENAHAGVASWNTKAGGGAIPSWAGAGDQYAVWALGNILEFASGLGTSNAPHDLSLANESGNVQDGAGAYGGLFSGDSNALPGGCDYVPNNPTFESGDITPRTINPGTKRAIYVKGDVYISADGAGNSVAYNLAGWNSTNIPSFKVVALGGNIYIDKNVTRMDGTYVAEPDESGAGGIIYTCATGMGAAVDPDNGSSLYDNCNKQLTINGSFAAKQVRFLRTFGSLLTVDGVSGVAGGQTRSSDSTAAEKFVYGPEMWINANAATTFGGDSSYTGLPPIL